MESVQGDYNLELRFVDSRIFLNFWDTAHGNDVCCQIVDGKLQKFIHTPMQVEEDEKRDNPMIEDVFEKQEIAMNEFINLVKQSILKQ